MLNIDDNQTSVKIPLTVAPSHRLLGDGWQQGLPVHILPETDAIDRRVCRRLKCPRCGRRGLTYHPFGKGSRYMVVAGCPDCGHEEEV